MERCKHFIWPCWLVISLLCTACSSGQSLNSVLIPTAEFLEMHPASKPQFVLEYSTQAEECLFISRGIKFAVDQRAFLTSENSGEKLNEFVKSPIVFVDGEPVERNRIIYLDYLQPMPEKGTNLFFGYGEHCVNVDQLASGLHLITIEFTPPRGPKHEFTWAFRS